MQSLVDPVAEPNAALLRLLVAALLGGLIGVERERSEKERGIHHFAGVRTFPMFALLGASGLTVEGPTDAMIECGTVYGAMGRRAAKTLVVADHSKFDRTFPSRYLPWRDVAHLVTDAEPEGSLMSSLELNEVAVTIG